MQIKVTGSFLTSAIRSVPDPYEVCAKVVPDLSVSQVAAIRWGTARIEGDNISGYEYVEEGQFRHPAIIGTDATTADGRFVSGDGYGGERM